MTNTTRPIEDARLARLASVAVLATRSSCTATSNDSFSRSIHDLRKLDYVTKQNSSAPDAERDIVSVESYSINSAASLSDTLTEADKERLKSAPA